MHLPILQSSQRMFILLGLHQPQQVADSLGLDLTISGGLELTQRVIQQLLAVTESTFSGAILEPTITFPIFLDKFSESKMGLALSLAQQNTQMNLLPTLLSQWSVDDVANNYAIAYLPLFYHPSEELALEKKQLVAEIHDTCQRSGIELIIDLSIYLQEDQPNQPVVFQETQLQAVQELRTMAELLILQYPQDALAAATLTAELDVPWVATFLSLDYEDTKQQLRTSLENGAKGFLIADALWPELGTFRLPDASPDMTKIEEYIATTVRDRAIELTRITNEFGKD